jgi:hypothetical protein
MTLSPTTLYWTGPLGVYSCPLAGCGAAPDGPFGPSGDTYGTYGTMGFVDAGSSSLVVAAGTDSAGLDIFSMTPDGTDTAGVQVTVGGWAIDSDAVVYWFDGANVTSVGVRGGPLRPIMAGIPAAYAMAVDTDTVYVATGQSLLACANGQTCGTSPLTISLDGAPTLVATEPDAANVYFANTEALYRCPSTGCPDPSFVNRWTGSQGSIGAMVADGNALYWTDSENGTVLKCAHGETCATPTTIASGLLVPRAIAVDDSYVYWTLGAGSVAVQRAPK